MTIDTATLALASIPRDELARYHSYFDSIRPMDNTEIFRRGLFAFASVHTTWRKNVDLFALLWDLNWMGKNDELYNRINESRAGLTNGRTKFISQFTDKFWANPESYLKLQSETWPQYRDRIEAMTLGLGHAKTSFFVEMLYFQDAQVVCGDTHQLQMFGLKGSKSPGRKTMNYIEQHWVLECTRLQIPPVTARWFLWDRKQQKNDSRYWSYVLEGTPPSRTVPYQMEFQMGLFSRRAA